jgi:heme-degrading monooxygenase HmoA
MFIHMVIFTIQKKNARAYLADCRMWAKEAKKHRGFLGFQTLIRTNAKNQYASTYSWKKEADHARFMKKHHDRLVALSNCPVKVVGYFNFNRIQK